jgi:hypothetical protein
MSLSPFSHFRKWFSSLKERAGEHARKVRVKIKAINIAVKELEGVRVP